MKHIIIVLLILVIVSCSTLGEILIEISSSLQPTQSVTKSEAEEITADKTNRTKIEIVQVNFWDKEKIDTVTKSNYLNQLEKNIIIELNKVRTNPSKYSELYIEPMCQYFNGTLYQYPNEIALRTKEGVSAVNECIRFLNSVTPIEALHPSEGLYKAAKNHMDDQSKTGQTGHTGSDGSSMSQRIDRYGKWEKIIGENIAYGPTDAQWIVTGLLVDDGVPSRGHRKNIFNPEFKVIGVSYGVHPKIRTVTVMDFAGGFVDN